MERTSQQTAIGACLTGTVTKHFKEIVFKAPKVRRQPQKNFDIVPNEGSSSTQARL